MSEQKEPPKKRGRGRPKGSHWSPEQRAKQCAQRRKAKEERDAQKIALIEANPDKTKKELGIQHNWRPIKNVIVNYGSNLRYARVAQNLPPINIKNPKEVEERVNQYFDFCQENNLPPNHTGLANWLGVHMQTVARWRRGDYGEVCSPIIQKAFMIIEDSLITQVQLENKNPAGGIFLLKSTCGFREQQELTVYANSGKEREMSAEEIAAKYLNDVKKVETTFKEDEE